MQESRPFQVIVYGATGYSGAIAVEYLARYADSDFKWAIAGRDASKLEKLKERLGRIGKAPDEYFVAEADKYESVLELTWKTRLLCSFVGPYRKYGEPVVRACVESGTDYIDVTGEPPAIASLIERHNEMATTKGIYLLPACGISSLITDMAVEVLKEDFARDGESVVEAIGYLRFNGRHAKTFSNGTWNTLINSMASKVPRAQKVVTKGQGQQKKKRIGTHLYRPLNNWAVPFVEGADLHTIRLSNELNKDSTGNDVFSYNQFVLLPFFPPLWLIGTLLMVIIIMFFSKFAMIRRWLQTRHIPQGGPSSEEREATSVDLWVLAKSSNAHEKMLHMHCPGPYDTTGIACAEAILILATQRDQLRKLYGVVTPASLISLELQRNLKRHGLITWKISDKSK